MVSTTPVNLIPSIPPIVLRVADDERLRADLAHAIAARQLVLHFQPRICLHTRAIVAAEALARWPHRRRGMIPPTRFVAMAEESDLIIPLGAWALENACAEAATWPQPVSVSVNASGAQLVGGVLLRQVSAALMANELPPERLEIELTESVLVNADVETLLTLSAIRDLGVGLALDDFGTGYASLSALKRLPLTCLKLDRSLVRGVLHHPEDTAIVRAVVATGQALGLQIVAEGVDDEAQRIFLSEIGCQQAQSFFFGRPTSADRFRASLQEAMPT